MGLSYRPDSEMAARHIEAGWRGEMIDRPVISITIARRKLLIGLAEPAAPDDPEQARWDIEYLCRRAEYQFDSAPHQERALVGSHEKFSRQQPP